jgi:hypothetical protein
MRSETVKIRIYGEGELTQEVNVEYEIMPSQIRDWEVINLKVTDVIRIEPTDLNTDLADQIAFLHDLPAGRVKIACPIECEISAEDHKPVTV